MQKKVSSLLPKSFDLILKGLSTDNTYYLSIFSTFLTRRTVYFHYLPTYFFSERRESFSREHIFLIEFLFGIFNKNFEYLFSLVGDYCSTTRKFAELLNENSFAYALYWSNYAVSDILSIQATVSDSAHI